MTEQLKDGDTVQLKSGGPVMTIEKVAKFGMGAAREQAKCVWFDGKKQMGHIFELSSLKISD